MSLTLAVTDLPGDIVSHIFQFLSFSDVSVVSLVCRSWDEAANENSLWKHFVRILNHIHMLL